MAVAIRIQDQPAFGRESPVLAYWLAHSEGFRVRGSRGSAVVENVYVDPPGRVTALAVRGKLLRRRRLMPASAFEEVVPAEQLLVAARPVRAKVRVEAVPLTRIAARRSRSWARAAAPRLERFGRLAVERGEAAVRAAAPHVEQLARRALHAARVAVLVLVAACASAARRFAAATDGESRRRWVGKTKLAGATAGNTISRSCSRASAVAAARATAVARARSVSRSSWLRSSWLPERQPRSSERPPPRI